MPAALAQQGVFEARSEVAACGNEKGTAAHGWIEDPQLQDLVSRTPLDERSKRGGDEMSGNGSRRVEAAARLSGVARPGERRWRRPDCQLVIEHPFINASQLLHIQVAINE